MTYDVYEADTATARRWNHRTIEWDEVIEWVKNPASKKECGGYVFARFKGDLRRNADLICKRVITLDFDKDAAPVREALARLGVKSVLHSTWQHAPDDHRYRVLVPADRDILPGEYEVVAESLAQALGIHAIDRTCFRPTQFMWKPSTQNLDWYVWDVHQDETLISVDALLLDYDSELAVQAQAGPTRHQIRHKRDPFELDGVIGAFNRAHQDLGELVEEFDLPYVQVTPGRFRYEEASSVAGMGAVDGKPGLYYSHHASDPAGLQALTAFDVVRVHRFGDLDSATKPGTPVNKLPSYGAAQDFAAKEECTRREMLKAVRDDFAEADMDPTLEEVQEEALPWAERLTIDRRGRVVDDQANRDLITLNDPEMSKVAYSELLETVVTTEPFSWDRSSRFRDVLSRYDYQQMTAHVERVYGVAISENRIEAMIAAASRVRSHNPITERLGALEWDGTPRMETCLPGVNATDYTRLVARKIMVGAVARAMEPGCKMDHCLVIYGMEGLGKTRWAYSYAMETEWISTLERIDRKDTLITMARSWFVLSDEVESLRRADFDALKSFLTKTHDNWRAPYEKEDLPHPRRCIVVATTNDRKFLRRQQGNRRFHVVEAVWPVDEATLERAYVEQVWAEAVHYWRLGEQLFLSPEEEALATEARGAFTQDDPLVGQVSEYLSMDVPADWENTSPGNRRLWYDENRFLMEGWGPQEVTCAMAIYREVMGQDKGQPNDRDSHRITDALDSAEGWHRAGRQHTVYGPQEVYVRDSHNLL